MACGNNKVTRAGLQTQPSRSVQLTTPTVDQAARQRLVQASQVADQQIAQAQAAISAASSVTAVRDALQSAQRALDEARRAGGDKQAKARLRSLERQVEELRKIASFKADDGTALDQRRHAALRDSLGRSSLGVPRRATTVSSTTSTNSPALSQAAQSAAVPETVIEQAEQAAQQAAARSVDLIVADKKTAQRALSAALRTGAPQEQVDRLKAVIKKLQQAESRQKSQSSPTLIDEVLAARAVPVDTTALLQKVMDNPLIPADLRADLPDAMQKVQDVSSHAPGLQVEQIAGRELGRSSRHGGTVWASTVEGRGHVHGYAYEIVAASRFIDEAKTPGNGGNPVQVVKGHDDLIFGQKLPAGPDRRTVEADILIVKEGGHKVGIDAKNYSRSYGSSKELKEQLEGVKEAIRQGEVHEFHFAVRGAITPGAKQVIAQADADLRAEMEVMRTKPGSMLSDLQALSVDITRPVICWHEELG